MKRLRGVFIALLATSWCLAQTPSNLELFFKPSDTLNKPRRNGVVITEVSLASATLVGLNQLWYKDYPKSKFHTTNDNAQWLQMDKLGHVYTAYQMGALGADLLNWSGVSKKDQLLYGATLGFTFLTAVEVFDGFSKAWGFSWGDMVANAAGTGLYVSQELLWDEQRIVMKYSFHQTKYAKMNPEKLGDGLAERLLKDYNGQTYWLSFNVQSFVKSNAIPKWLNVAVGYSGEGMLTGVHDSDPRFYNQNRSRQYLLSLDVDLSRINTKSHVLKSIFGIFNTIKVPLPTVEFNDKNGIKLHGIYF
ncbi:hypothetical protein IA57_00580 [Mangrovimonas yunxiaonensis]|uniref:DUF2279 domain-containing protein n=1 Tax=Mangrovimonas yunxiaonensis TaxID=1197477 RepID=A0A084TN86_9FLAO|nr:hypothetical protein IA57_00580 [Mangrovimonas yunxiaonensis]